MSTTIVLTVALILDAVLGEPDWLWRRVTHPVVMFGKVIAGLEKHLFPGQRDLSKEKRAGVVLIMLAVGGSLLAGWMVAAVLDALGIVGSMIECVIVAVLLAQKSLHDHVSAVATGLRDGGLAGGQKAVSMIVGRDPNSLDRSGVSRAAIESLAENTSDGVVAPALFYLVFGLAGLFAYKMINTADSMIGHRSPRYLDFGWAAARLDDVANLVPARLTGLLAVSAFALAGRGGAAWRTMMRDHSVHRSPNAGWPESAFAGGLGVALGGPRAYVGDVADEPFMNPEGRRDADIADIERALTHFRMLCALFLLLVAMIAILI